MFQQNTAIAPSPGAKVLPFPGLDLGPGVRFERIGPHVLIQGDCREILPQIGQMDAIVTDPPYGESPLTVKAFGSSGSSAKTSILISLFGVCAPRLACRLMCIVAINFLKTDPKNLNIAGLR